MLMSSRVVVRTTGRQLGGRVVLSWGVKIDARHQRNNKSEWLRSFSSTTVPSLVESIPISGRRNGNNIMVDAFEVWDTTCIVTNFARPANCSILINPANPNLSGVSNFPYFPRGGPEPPHRNPVAMGQVTQWGGMDVGDNMMFASQVVDGMVHQMGGKALAEELYNILLNQYPQTLSCPVGQAVLSGPGDFAARTFGGEDNAYYQHIVHTVPPFFKQGNNGNNKSNLLLADAYQNAIQLIANTSFVDPDNNNKYHDDDHHNMEIRVACPLIGAGCRGFPTDLAIAIALQTLLSSSHQSTFLSSTPRRSTEEPRHSPHNITLAFGIPDPAIRTMFIQKAFEVKGQE